MSAYVVDASVVTKWFFPEPLWEYAVSLRRSGKELLAPKVLMSEMTHLLTKRVKGGQCDQPVAERILAALQDAPITWGDSADAAVRTLRVAREIDCSAWDAAYLALAIERGCPVVTADRKLRQVVKASRLGAHVLWIEDVS